MLFRSLELADVRADVLGDEERDFLRELERHGFGLLEDDRHPHFLLGRFDGHGQAPGKAGFEALVDSREVLRIGVAGDDQLLVRFDQGVERIEELFLGAVLAGEELNIVDEEQIQGMVIALELVEGFLLIGPDDIRDVLRGVEIAHPGARMLLKHVIADGVNIPSGEMISNAAVVRADVVAGITPPAKALKGEFKGANFVVPLYG